MLTLVFEYLFTYCRQPQRILLFRIRCYMF